MSDTVNVRASEMAKVIAALDQMQAEAALAVSKQGGFSDYALGALSALYVYLRDGQGMKASVSEGLAVTKRAIDELAGRRVTDAYGNLMVRAYSDDQSFTFWVSYAEQTGKTLALNLEHASFSIRDMMKSSLSNLKVAGNELKDELAAPSAIVITVLILVVAILILK